MTKWHREKKKNYNEMKKLEETKTTQNFAISKNTICSNKNSSEICHADEAFIIVFEGRQLRRKKLPSTCARSYKKNISMNFINSVQNAVYS